MSGGGTGGHIYPALAISELIQRNEPNSEIAFVGTPHGMENKLIPAAGYRLYHVPMSGVIRSLSLANAKTAYYMLTSPGKAKKIIREFQPDLVIGTGAYVCWPLLRAAASMHIPTMVHESNALPGMAVKSLQRNLDVIMTNFSETASFLKQKEKIINVGNPLRNGYGQIDREEARKKLGIPPSVRFVILSFGGSLGAPALNRAALDLMRDFSSRRSDVMHIHASGVGNYEEAQRLYQTYFPDGCRQAIVKDYIQDMPWHMAAADLVISRAGAMTLTELAMAKKTAVLIPSPNVTDNHQYKNAKVLFDAGAAELLEEKELTAERMCALVSSLADDEKRRSDMSQRIFAFANPDTERRIYEEIVALLQRKKEKGR